MAKKPDYVRFIVKMKDGTEQHMSIDKYTLQRGDHVARTIAREQQEKGILSPGEIADVWRALEQY